MCVQKPPESKHPQRKEHNAQPYSPSEPDTQHTVCAPRLGRKTLDGGTRYEDGVLLVPDCRKLRQEIVRSTCMDPGGSIRPDYIAYAGTCVFVVVLVPKVEGGCLLRTVCDVESFWMRREVYLHVSILSSAWCSGEQN